MEREFLEGQGLTPEAVEAVLAEHDRQVRAMQLQSQLYRAVTKAGGRSEKAIAALLDLEAIAESGDVAAAMDAAVQELKQTDGYLFAAPPVPAYAAGTGTHTPEEGRPATLAEALRQRSRQ